MSAYQIFTQPSQQALDTAANVLSGATLTFSLTGTSTPTNAYSDSALTTPVANPLSANSAGVWIPIFLDPTVSYRIVLKTQAGAVLQTWDPANENVLGLLTLSYLGQILYPRTPAELSAGVTPSSYGYPPGDVRRYGAVGNGSITGGTGTNDSTAFSSANSIGIETIVDGALIYRISSDLTLSSLVIRAGSTISVDSGATLTISGRFECDSTVPFAGPGYVAFGATARPGRLTNILPDRAAGVPVRGGCQYHAFGDSYTSGTGVTTVTRYPALFASRFNATENNHGVGGRGVTRANLEAYQNLPKYGARAMLITWLSGFNDLHYGTSNPKTLVKIESEAKAFLANAFLKSAVPADDSTVTKTGSWSNATPGTWADKGSQSLGGHAMFSSTNADKISYTFTGTNVVVGYWQGSNTTYTLCDFDVYIDSTFVETISPNNTTDGNVGFPEVYENLTHAVLLYTTLGGGSHTIELRLKSSNNLMVDYFGTLSSPGDCPSVLMGEIPFVDSAGYASPESGRNKTIDAAGSAAILRAAQSFQCLGYPVAFVPINDYYNYQANIQSDHDHPNVTGHQQIAAAFSAYTFGHNFNAAPSCTFNKAATQALTTATLTAVTYSSATDDFFGFRDGSNTSRIYAPMTGTMRLSGTIVFASNATGLRDGTVYLNGTGTVSAYLYGMAGFAGIDNGFPFCVDIPVVAGDYAEIKVSQNSGGNLNLQTTTRVSAMMLR